MLVVGLVEHLLIFSLVCHVFFPLILADGSIHMEILSERAVIPPPTTTTTKKKIKNKKKINKNKKSNVGEFLKP